MINNNIIEDVENKEQQPKFQRMDSLDLLRGFCIFGMIFNHSFLYLEGHGVSNFFDFLIVEFLTCFLSAATFLVVSGMSSGLSSIKRKSEKKELSFFQYCIRGLFIILMGVFISLTGFYGKYNLFNFDILYLMGCISITTPIITDFTPNSLLFCCAIFLLVSPFMRRDPNFLPPWGQIEPLEMISKIFKIDIWCVPELDYLWNLTLRAVFEGGLYNGFFPIFPYASYYFIGVYLSKISHSGQFEEKKTKHLILGGSLIVIGFILAIIGGIQKNPIHSTFASPFSYYPVSFSHSIVQAGSVFFAIIIFHSIFDQKDSINNFFINAIRNTGKNSLTFYVYSIFITFMCVHVKVWTTGKNIDDVFPVISGFWVYLFAIGLWGALSFILIPISQKYNGIGTLEHLLRLVQGG